MSTEVGVERKLHSAFVWSEKSIKLLSCELHRKEQPRNTHRGSLAISFFFLSLSLSLLQQAEGAQVVVAFGQSEKGKKEERRKMFFIAKPVGAVQYISSPYGTGSIKYAC